MTPLSAFAQEDTAAVEKVTALNQKAIDAYNDLEFEEARKILKQALDLCSSAGLDKHPITARTHIHMGVVLIAAKQEELGIKQFRKAIEIQPDIQVTKSLANPEILQAFEDARSGAPSGGGGGDTLPPSGGGDSGGAAPGGAGGGPTADITHLPITRGKKGKPIAIAAVVSPDLTGYTKVVLEYRIPGGGDFQEREMKRSGNRFTAEIPSDATKGASVSYYIEAEAADESTIASSGTEERPFVVALSGTGGGRRDGDDEGESEAGGVAEGGGPPLFFALMGGTGIGYATGHGEVNVKNNVSAGFAPSSVAQISPEVGYFITPSLRLSLQARIQFVSGATPIYLDKVATMVPNTNVNACGSDHICSAANGAVAVFARGSWFFGSDNLQPYFSFALGGGQIRHVVKFNKSMPICGPNANEVCVDTVLAGPVFAGAGGGIIYNLTQRFGLVGEVNSLLGIPKVTVHFDVNAGVAARF